MTQPSNMHCQNALRTDKEILRNRVNFIWENQPQSNNNTEGKGKLERGNKTEWKNSM